MIEWTNGKYSSQTMRNTTLLCALVMILYSCQSNIENRSTSMDFETPPSTMELLYPEEISTKLFERDFALSPDRNEVIYTLGNYDQSLRMLVSFKKENNSWGDKTVLPISGKYNDIEPFFSPDGTQLFFASNRPIYGDSTRTDYNIWVSTKQNNEWQEPEALDSIINTKGQEYYPAVGNSGNLYFTATTANGIGLEDIYVSTFSKNRYENPKVLDTTINSKSYEFNAYVNPEETLIIYSSYGRPDGLGGGDLYYSTKDEQGNWQAAKHLGPQINSEKLDFCPFYDQEKQVLYFSSLRTGKTERLQSVDALKSITEKPQNGMSDIYRIPINLNDD